MGYTAPQIEIPRKDIWSVLFEREEGERRFPDEQGEWGISFSSSAGISCVCVRWSVFNVFGLSRHKRFIRHGLDWLVMCMCLGRVEEGSWWFGEPAVSSSDPGCL